MDSRSLLRKERQALCDTLSSLGPDAPTLCEGWTTADLAAHLQVREREPLAAAGIVLPGPFVALNHRRMEAANVGEYFVHHEDARRANGMEPRPSDPDLDMALWRMLRVTGRRQLRGLRGFGVVAQRPDGRSAVLRKGFPEVEISGAPGEVVLYLMGRKQAARVELSGSEMAVAALSNASLRA